MEKETGVRVGQQYVKVDSLRDTPPVWEVNSIYQWWKATMAKLIGVRVGQQYVKVDSPRNTPPVWEVNSILSGVIADHAGLVNLDDPMYKKTVSFSALLDKSLYRLVSDVNAAA